MADCTMIPLNNLETVANALLKPIGASIKGIKRKGQEISLVIEGEQRKSRQRFTASATIKAEGQSVSEEGFIAALRSGVKRTGLDLPRNAILRLQARPS